MTLAQAALSSSLVTFASFSGSLTDLAAALRSGQVQPDEIPLLTLTRELLTRIAAAHFTADEHAELLPTLAGVIALKARLLLPKPPALPEPDDDFSDDEGVDDVLAGVEALAELGALVAFLSQRRSERSGLIAARPVDLGLPRRMRPAQGSAGLAKLVTAARSAVRAVELPLLARERLTLAGALRALGAFGTRLQTFTFFSVPVADWNERATYFSALLEGIKTGSFSAEQAQPFEDIQVEFLGEAEAEPDSD
ncbi:segregation/condensation protein A [Deinococcus sp.]|uniref:segregation/condensation protein A n=1 Tax=Deinococcus sp. TaxID=47478 RepID=UPI003B58FA74